MKKDEVIKRFRLELCGFLGYDEHLISVGKSKALSAPTENKACLEPRDFLNFAVEDSLTLDNERSRVNCLGNSKRAIDAQIDRLIQHLGFLPLARKQRWNIPRKLEFIAGSGVLAPRILRRITHLRNRLEHEFTTPSKRDVEDSLDVAALFVSYAELVRVPTMNWTLASKLTVRYDYHHMVFHFFTSDKDEEPLLTVSYGKKEFQAFYDFLIKTVPSMERGAL